MADHATDIFDTEPEGGSYEENIEEEENRGRRSGGLTMTD